MRFPPTLRSPTILYRLNDITETITFSMTAEGFEIHHDRCSTQLVGLLSRPLLRQLEVTIMLFPGTPESLRHRTIVILLSCSYLTSNNSIDFVLSLPLHLAIYTCPGCPRKLLIASERLPAGPTLPTSSPSIAKRRLRLDQSEP